MIGAVTILNVGEGDTKLVFDPSKPDDRKRAAKVVADMLRRGYALLVQVGEQDGKPLYQRAEAFNEQTCEYIIAGGPYDGQEAAIDIGAAPRRRAAKKASTHRVPAATTSAVSVGRTAGG